MDYKKYHLNNYDLYVIPLHKFKTTNVVFEFVKPYKEEDNAYFAFLSNITSRGTLKYPKTADYEKEFIKLYGLDLSRKITYEKNNIFYGFNLNIINKEYSTQDNFKNSILFIQDAILHPIVLDTKLSRLYFNDVKNSIIINHKNWLSNIQKQVDYRSSKYFMQNNFISHVPTIKEYTSLTPEKISDYYKKLMQKSFLNVYVCGDVDCDEVYHTFKDVDFPCMDSYEINSYNIVEKRSKERHLVTTNKGTDSYVRLFYTFDDLSFYEEQFVAPVLEQILTSPSGRLFQTIREKHSLCYAIGCDYADLSHTLSILSTTSVNNIKQLKKLANQTIEDIKNGEIQQDEIDEKIKIICDYVEDGMQYKSPSINYLRNNLYYHFAMPDELIKSYKKVKVTDIVKLAKKMHFDSAYISKGSKNE